MRSKTDQKELEVALKNLFLNPEYSSDHLQAIVDIVKKSGMSLENFKEVLDRNITTVLKQHYQNMDEKKKKLDDIRGELEKRLKR